MIKLEQNKIPGYTVCDSGFVTLVFADGITYPTCLPMKDLGFKAEGPKSEPEKQGNQISEEGLLSLMAIINKAEEIPR